MSKMQAIILRQFGQADQLRIGEITKPVPGKNQVLIKIKAIGINPVDTKVRAGTNRMAKNLKLPAVIGWDASGIITECGSEVTGFKAGDAVFGCIGFPGPGGAYAEYAPAETNAIALKPENVSFEEAAALPIAGLTAYQVIHEHLSLQPGEKVLIQAAAGGVGHLAVQLARQEGAVVIGTASEKNRDFLESLCIDLFIDYKKEKFEQKAGTTDAVIDALGGDILHRSIGCTRAGGRVVCLPSSTKNDPEALKLAAEKNITLIWPLMHDAKEQLALLVQQLATGKLKIHLDKIYTFEEMVSAHQAIESHTTRGKIVVRVEENL